MLRNYFIVLLALVIIIFMSCSSSKNQLASSEKCKVYLDSVYNKHYYFSDSTRIYLVIPEELKNNIPEYVYEDNKGYTFATLNDDIIEIDADTTNALYMGYPSAAVTQSTVSKENLDKKSTNSKAKKKVRTTKKTKVQTSKKKS
jgi:hypothetical protein